MVLIRQRVQVIRHLEKNPYSDFTTYVATDFDNNYCNTLISATASSKVVFKVRYLS
jgi:hypothetical protein